MNTNILKRFAQEARKKLMQQVAAKLDFVLTTDTAELREKQNQIDSLKKELHENTREHVIEKVAYTWFNRFMALRFMDANDYQPLGMRIISPIEGYTLPELLSEAKQGNIHEDLQINQQQVFDLLDGKLQSQNPQNEAFKYLLVAACNNLHAIFPYLFERIEDYTELLLPEDLTSEFSIINDIVNGMSIKDCQQVEIIGWLYQFYISEKKDEVFASKSKVSKEDIPAATQLFTPRWIVEYMVQNTLGKLWLQNHPESSLKEHMPYYIESASTKSEDYLKINSPEEIKLVDPACGSGHILVYAFDLLTKIYEEQGYSQSEIPQLIIQNNLYGLEIDERAAQLSSMALMMKAREYHRRVFRKKINPNINCYQDLHISEQEIKETISLAIKPSQEILHDLRNMQQATNLGSLIIPHANQSELQTALEKVQFQVANGDMFTRPQLQQLETALKQLLVLGQKYHAVVANPPYMGGGNMNKELSKFVKDNYPDSKADLMACFMESGSQMLLQKAFLGMINQHSWMFLGSYEKLRAKLIKETFMDTLLHLGPRTFPEIGGEVVQNAAFTFWNKLSDDKGTYIRLVDEKTTEEKREKTIQAIQNPNCGWFFTTNQKNFQKIPGSPFGYWLSKNFLNIFNKIPLKEKYSPKSGMSTTNNDRFLRLWFEESLSNIAFNVKNEIDSIELPQKWYPYGKGGEYRKWYGNNFFVVNFKNNGSEIKESVVNNPNDPKTTHWSRRIFGTKLFYKPGVTWSRISSNKIAFRNLTSGFIFSDAGPAIFPEVDSTKNYYLGLLNSKVVNSILAILNPTLTFQVGNIASIPIDEQSISNNFTISKIVNELIEVFKYEWNSRETSWDFQQNELIRIKGQDLEESFYLYQQYWSNKFYKLHANEEELNAQFIEIYDLQEELTPDVPLDEITILKEEIDQKALKEISTNYQSSWKLENNKWQLPQKAARPQLPFNSKEIMSQFISYAVGCMFGRYSLDKEGLILANQGQTLEDYLKLTEQNRNEGETFLPDDDNIIPILDDEWFDDDIVGRFKEFLKVSFGTQNFEKNLAFIEDCIGKDIRKYFVKDFYTDHIKRYKKRPIYWMFSSPKGVFNVLIYMHRYTPDTVSNILNGYLREYQDKLRTSRENWVRLQVSGSAAEKNKAVKELEKIDKIVLELNEYEREVLYPIATDRIAIDLDDGVLVNYNKFGKAIKAVTSLNDAKTKKKVKAFDWIDTSLIK